MVSHPQSRQATVDLMLDLVIILADNAPVLGRGLDRADRHTVMAALDALMDAITALAPGVDLDQRMHDRRRHVYGVPHALTGLGVPR